VLIFLLCKLSPKSRVW